MAEQTFPWRSLDQDGNRGTEVEPAVAGLKPTAAQWLTGGAYEVVAQEAGAASTSAIGFWKIAMAVFVGNTLTGIVAAVVYVLTHS